MSTSTSNSSPHRPSQPSRPRLERVDGQPLPPDALERRRFGITIQSIYYYPTLDGVCCAILLKTCFELRMGDKFASAIVPLSAKPLRTTAENANKDEYPEQIDISGHFPTTAEWVEVARLSGSKDVFITPNIGVNVLGSGVDMSGVGMNRHMPEERSYKISLNPVQQVLANHPTYLKWKYEDPEGIFYPPNTTLLVIVENSTDDHKLWFPFELILEWKLRVDIHGILDRVVRLVGKPRQHDGWCFQIKGQYNPAVAQAALEDAKRSDQRPSVVGLHAAVKGWMDAQNSTKNIPISSPPVPAPST